MLIGVLFRNYTPPAEKKRYEQYRRLKETNSATQLPPEPRTPVWLTVLFWIVGIVFWVGPTVAGLITGDIQTWMWVILVGGFFVVVAFGSKR